MNIQMNYLFEAAKDFAPEAELAIINDKITWIKPENAPVNDEILFKRALELSQKSAYKDLRKEKYPPLHDQLDMLWHSIDNGSLDKESDFYKSIKAVKDEFPKP
jgi:hypothetical protein